MEMALRLKRMQNQTRIGTSKIGLEDDMQVFYVCKVCKITFEDSKFEEYKEHKKQHDTNGDLQAQSNSVKQESEKKKPGRKKRSLPVVAPSTSTPENGTSKRRSRRSPVPKQSPAVNTTKNTNIKIYECEVCDQIFENHKARYWHRLRAHGMFAKAKPSHNTSTPNTVKSPNEIAPKLYPCRYCDKVFDKRHSKYNHERVCVTKSPVQEQNNQSENDSEVMEQPMPEEPVVDLNDDDVSNNGDETHNPEGIFTCSRCSLEFASARSRTTHEKTVHNLHINECRSCGKMFSSYPNRYQHQKRCMLNKSIDEDEEQEEDIQIAETGFQTVFAQSL